MLHSVLVPVEERGRRVLVPFGPTTRRRQFAAGLVVMTGAVPVYLLANSSYGRPPRLSVVVLTIGIVGIAGWLLDGYRYLGAGAGATAVGGGLTISREAFIAEYTMVFGLLAVALICLVRVNPRALNGTAGLLIYVGAASAVSHEGVLPRGVSLAIVMLAWGGIRAWRAYSADHREQLVVAPEPG